MREQRNWSATLDLLSSQQNERDKLKVAEKHQRETADKCQTRFRVQKSREYNLLPFVYNLANDYSWSWYVLIDTMTEVCSNKSSKI